jgi:hypothetical protein
LQDARKPMRTVEHRAPAAGAGDFAVAVFPGASASSNLPSAGATARSRASTEQSRRNIPGSDVASTMAEKSFAGRARLHASYDGGQRQSTQVDPGRSRARHGPVRISNMLHARQFEFLAGEAKVIFAMTVARKARAERMMRKVKPTAVKIVAQALSNVQGKFSLRCFGKTLAQCRRPWLVHAFERCSH